MIEGQAVLSGAGTLTVIGGAIWRGQSSLSGVGTLSTIGGLIWEAEAVLSGVGTLEVRGLVPLTTEMISQIVVSIDDRDLYNDVRSQVDITEQHEDTTPAVYESGEVKSDRFILWGKETGHHQATITLTSPRQVSSWLSPYAYDVYSHSRWPTTKTICENVGGDWDEDEQICWYVRNSRGINVYVTKSTDTYIELLVSNILDVWVELNVAAPYRYIAQDSYTKTRTETYTLKVRSTDSTSIAKYGRRVMNLVWPLGQTEEQMTDLVDAYLERYKEPIPQLSVKLLGVNDAMVQKILNTHISDKVWIDDMNDYFFVNAMNSEHHVSGLLESRWELEQIRDYERGPLFTLDTSQLDSLHVLGW